MFIYEDKINKKICKDLIDVFKKNKKIKEKNKHTEMTTVFCKSSASYLNEYSKAIMKIINNYKKKYEYVDKNQSPWSIFPLLKIQKYEPKKCYHSWHCELDGAVERQKRILAFTTYLNDIKEGGETEFLYQKTKIKPTEGKTILFPPFWTHTHKGNTTKEIKYIVTGWFSYVH